MTKSQEMRARIPGLMNECQSFINDGKAGEAKAKMDEINELKNMIAIQEQLEAEEKADFQNSAAGRMQTARSNDAAAEFADAARNYFKNAMTEGTNKDGGYTVPEDISTQVKNYREDFFDMTQYVNVEKVSTKSGARTYQKKKTVTGFQVVGEGTAIPGLAQPEFERIAFTIAKYAGIIPVTRELLSDSDANIVRIIMRWFGRKGEIAENDFNLNIPRYVDTYEPPPPIDIVSVTREIADLNRQIRQTERKLLDYLRDMVGMDDQHKNEMQEIVTIWEGICGEYVEQTSEAL